MHTLPRCNHFGSWSGNARDQRSVISSSSGFSLVELLAVIAIIGIVVALLLPAVQGSREAARRSQCQSRLRQVGSAALQYETAYGHLPPGHLGPVPARAVTDKLTVTEFDHQLMGVLPYLLPYIEYAEVFEQVGPDMLDFRSEPSFQIWALNSDSWEAAHRTIALFLCPSSPSAIPSTGALMFLNPYYDNDIINLVLEAAPIPRNFAIGIGITNYLGNAGYFGVVNLPLVDEWRGPFTTRSDTRFAEITDGTSTTLLFGEAVGLVHRGDLKFAYSWMGCGAMPVAFGIGDIESWANFSSEHPGVVGFCFADGSVRYLDVDIDQGVLEAMGGISEGEIVDVTRI